MTNLSDVDVEQNGIYAGVPSYITQEEFNRYAGFWWNPQKFEDDCNFILYEEVDSSAVDIVSLIAHDDIHERQRFPRAGGTNTKSNLKIIEFNLASNLIRRGTFDIYEHFPWCEYVVRMDWTPDGQK